MPQKQNDNDALVNDVVHSPSPWQAIDRDRLIAEAPEMFEIIRKLAEIDWIEGTELHKWIYKSREIVQRVV